MRAYYKIKIEDKGIGARITVGTTAIALSYNLKSIDYRNEFEELFALICARFAMTPTKYIELRAAFSNAIRKAKGWSFNSSHVDLSGIESY